MDASDEMYLIFDLNLNLVDFNLKTEQILSVGKNFMGRNARETLIQHPELLHMFQSAGNDSLEYSIAGTIYSVKLHSIFDEYSTKVGTFLIGKDITLQRQIETELREISMMKTKLLATMGHDLQGTLSGLALSSESLLASFDPTQHEDKIGLLESMRDGSKSCVTLVDQLLLWSKSQLGANFVRNETVEIHTVLKEVLSFMQPIFIDKGIQVYSNYSGSTMIETDINVLRTILRNLLSNAAKFTPIEGRIDITVQEEAKFTRITIEDSGSGVAKEDLEEIFDLKPNRLNGMGLYLSSEFAIKIGGKICSEKKLGKGGIFHVLLPGLNLGST
jgi:signal transduction histidine kinase